MKRREYKYGNPVGYAEREKEKKIRTEGARGGAGKGMLPPAARPDPQENGIYKR